LKEASELVGGEILPSKLRTSIPSAGINLLPLMNQIKTTIAETPMERLRLATFGLDIDMLALQRAACQLEASMPEPSVAHYFFPPHLDAPLPSLFQPPRIRGIPFYPEAVFSTCSEVCQQDVPADWLEAHIWWARKLAGGEVFAEAISLCRSNPHEFKPGWNITSYPAAAGALLYCVHLPLQSPLRQSLLEAACRSQEGAYFAAESLHAPEERLGIVNALGGSTRLLYWASRIPQLQRLCVLKSMAQQDLWAALTLLRSQMNEQDLKTWFHRLIFRACTEPRFASCALVLFPTTNRTQRLFVRTIQSANAAHWAYETARFGAANLAPESIAELRKVAVSDKGRYWMLWYRDVEPCRAQQALDTDDEADPLWAAELLHASGLDGRLLRTRMLGEYVSHSFGPSRANIILQFLERREAEVKS
jgi:hypothetical protein